MAQSRLEKVGTIYNRTRGLLQAGAMKWNDRPLWYDIYEAFPPAEEPRYDRPAPKIDVKEIFYQEDKIRALVHAEVKNLGTTNLLNRTTKSLTQRVISTYKKLEEQYEGTEDPKKIFKESLELVKKERETERDVFNQEHESLQKETKTKQGNEKETKTKEGKEIPILSLNIKGLLKE